MTVSPDGTGDYRSIQAAIDSVSPENRARIIIDIRPGFYFEKLSIVPAFITLRGENPETTVLSYNDYALKTFPDGSHYRTFNTFTILVAGNDFRAENLTVENTAGPGDAVGQAVAAYVDADRATFINCRLFAHQDTLFTGPLPPKPMIGSTFGGPREGHPRLVGRQYYRDCVIRGDIDFIFGSAVAVFHGCTVLSNECGKPVNGYISAASTPENAEYGYVFYECRLEGEASAGSVYLGRPWRAYAKTVFIRCYLGAHIHPEGWHNWDKPEAENSSWYGEFANTGPGAAIGSRARWSHVMSESEAERFHPSRVLSGHDGWNPVDAKE